MTDPLIIKQEQMDLHRANLMGAVLAVIILSLCILVFIFRLAGFHKLVFRKVTWIPIPYLLLFFGGTGGMIGVASLAGRIWTLSAAILFLVMTVLSLVQRTVTGM